MRSHSFVGVMLVATLLFGCGGGSSDNPRNSDDQPLPPVPPPTTPQINTVTRTTTFVGYASVARIALSSAELPDTTTTAQLTVKSGMAASLEIKDGEIRFITPTDPGIDTTIELRLATAANEIIVPIQIQSARPTQVITEIEPDEQGNLPAIAQSTVLSITGLGNGNALLGGDLSFAVASASALDPKASSATIFDPRTGTTYDLARD